MANDDKLSPTLFAAEDSERAAERLLAEVEAACDPGAGFVENLESTLRAALAFFVADPEAAGLLTVEPCGIGEAARHQRRLECFGGLLREAARAGSGVSPHPPFLETSLIAGVAWQVSGHVRAGRAEQLEELLPSLLEFVLAYYLDPAEAGRIARAAGAGLVP